MLAHQSHTRGRARRAAGALLAAVIAAATLVLANPAPASAYQPGDRESIKDVTGWDGAVYVYVYSYFESDGVWLRLEPDLTLEPLGPGDPGSAFLTSQSRSDSTCLPPDESPCFRPTPGRWGVDVSNGPDGPWQPELAVTDGQWQQITDEWDGEYWAPPSPETVSVSVVMWNGEPAVIAANEVDGIAIRGAKGDWQRYRHSGYAESLTFRAKSIPSAFPVGNPVVPVFVFAAVAAIVTGAARRRKRGVLGYVAGGVFGTLLGAVTLLAGAAAVATAHWSSAGFPYPLQMIVLPGFLALTAGSAALAIATFGWHVGSRGRDTVGVPLLIAVGSAVTAMAAIWGVDAVAGGDAATWLFDWRAALTLAITLVASLVVVVVRWRPAIEKQIEPREPGENVPVEAASMPESWRPEAAE